jgi:hypothetical protein
MVARNRNTGTNWPPPPQLSLHKRAALTTNSNGTKSAHKGKRSEGAGGIDMILMSMAGTETDMVDPDSQSRTKIDLLRTTS